MILDNGSGRGKYTLNDLRQWFGKGKWTLSDLRRWFGRGNVFE